MGSKLNTSRISVTILVKNAQDTIKECLYALKSFDEVIILDNKSTDNTLLIIQELNKDFSNLKVYHSEFIGFGALKNLAINYARNDWILSIDSDEILQDFVIDELNKLDLSFQTIVAFGRKNLYRGEWIKACGWYPDFVYRLFNKKFTKFNENIVHESIILPQNSQKIYIKNALKHYAVQNIESIINKMNFYTSFSATQKYNVNTKTNIFFAIVRFFLIFFKDYFLRKGFLYGYKGFIIALLNANGAFFRYAKLYELNKREK
ncbi:glycosyltransferase family 2 protein [Helicobacter sp. MIT 14-3879]|uniref:glycosyltransferase family 2 protein n=1 Tax=Helicobacter sp. MIT 14-3879 TaxID=2040649 RepID=UPI000E1F9FFC|nr:glycosyltransferase family 2 protein [Helicobacter sp. MIT 14-3879]RDU62468.1 glycosyltransferase family 2 protein [Helicobacter sp. MIT 14-3879]